MKYDEGKLRYDLIPPEILEELARAYTYGANKYEANSWQHVDPQRYYAALMRHLITWRYGKTYDRESNIHHLTHALWNVGTLLWNDINGQKELPNI